MDIGVSYNLFQTQIISCLHRKQKNMRSFEGTVLDGVWLSTAKPEPPNPYCINHQAFPARRYKAALVTKPLGSCNEIGTQLHGWNYDSDFEGFGRYPFFQISNIHRLAHCVAQVMVSDIIRSQHDSMKNEQIQTWFSSWKYGDRAPMIFIHFPYFGEHPCDKQASECGVLTHPNLIPGRARAATGNGLLWNWGVYPK